MGFSLVTSRLTQSSPISRRNGTYKHSQCQDKTPCGGKPGQCREQPRRTSSTQGRAWQARPFHEESANLLDEVAVQEHGDLGAQKGRHLPQQLLLVVAANTGESTAATTAVRRLMQRSGSGHGSRQLQPQQRSHHANSTGSGKKKPEE
jgi:hypothetical protein